MDWKLNAAQKAVLDWLCTSPEMPPPSETWKHAARALQGRELVSISRSGGEYTVSVTDVGRHVHKHGEYPEDSAGGRQTRRSSSTDISRSSSRASKPAQVAKPKRMAVTPPDLSPELTGKRFVRPHPAVRSLRDHPAALPPDAAGRYRGILAADMLVAAAIEAGIEVTAHEQPKKRTSGSPYTGDPLVTLDAGSAEVVVRIGEYDRQVEHVKTEEELESERRSGYSWSRRWDYTPTGLICLRLYTRLGTPTRLVETATKPLHEFVPRVIHLVQLATEKEIELAASHREYQRRVEERQKAAQVLAQRRDHYSLWEKKLLDGVESRERTKQMHGFLQELELKSGPESADFIVWAREYITHLDPVEGFEPPEGGVPDLSHEEETRIRSQPAPGIFDIWKP